MSDRLKKYIRFDCLGSSDTGKTKIWQLTNVKYGAATGFVKWHGAWRKYCFFPLDDTLFDWDCLRLIAEFCEAKTKEHYDL